MGERATADLIAEFLLRYYREPMRYRAQAPRATHVYGNLDVVLRVALGRTVAFSDPLLHVPATAAALARAATFFIQQQFFRDDATHYDVLGLAGDASPGEVRGNFRLLMQLIHPDRQGANALWPDTYAARANRAHAVLKSYSSRTDYDRQLTAARAREPSPQPATVVAGTRGPARIVPAPRPRARISVLPEWWTAGVGGFVRRHPGLTACAALVGVSVLAVVSAVDTEREGVLTLESGGYSTPLPTQARPVERPSRGADRSSTSGADFDARESAMVVVDLPVARAIELQALQPDSSSTTSQPARKVEAAPMAVATLPALGVKGPPFTLPPTQSPPLGAPRSGVAMPIAAPNRASPQTPAPTPVQSAPAPPPSAVAQMETRAPIVPVALPAMPPPAERRVAAIGPPPESAEVEVLIATFVSSYETGRLDTFSTLFDDDAQAGQQRGRAAIASEYDQLFRSTVWRHIAIFQLGWKPVGDHTAAKGEFLVKTGWRDGREVEQRMVVDMELVRQGGRTVIAKLSLQPR